MLNLKELEKYYSVKENQYLERKSARIKPLDILRHIVAFANAQGGELIIGIEDDGEITGFGYEGAHNIDEFTSICLTELKDTPIIPEYVQKEVQDSKGNNNKILIISVKPSMNKVIKSYDGEVYLRQNDKSKKLEIEQIIELMNDKGQTCFEDEMLERATMQDIDIELLHEYKKIMGVENISDEDVLRARNFLIEDKITKAGILLFGNNPTKFLPQARLRVIKYEGTESNVGKEINIVKERTFDKAIPRIIVEAKEFIGTLLRDFQYLDEDSKFKIMPEYPEFAWVEGIVNALTHRSYLISGEHIKVLIYDDRLEILSPGLLPNMVTLENIKEKRFSRNPRIARVLCEFEWVKELNEGVRRIYSEMEKAYLKKPTYSEPNGSVLLKLENNILNRHIRANDNIKKYISEEVFGTLNFAEKRVIQYMYNTGEKMKTNLAMKITGKGSTFCRKMLKNLENIGILEWTGISKTDSTQYYTLKF